MSWRVAGNLRRCGLLRSPSPHGRTEPLPQAIAALVSRWLRLAVAMGRVRRETSAPRERGFKACASLPRAVRAGETTYEQYGPRWLASGRIYFGRRRLVLPSLGARSPATTSGCPGAAWMSFRADVGSLLGAIPAAGQWSGGLALPGALRRRPADLFSSFWGDVHFRRAFSLCLGGMGNSWNALVVLARWLVGTSARRDYVSSGTF